MNGTPVNASPVRRTSEFLTVQETADMVRLSKRQIYRLLDDGILTGTYFGRKRLVDEASVQEFAQRVRNGEFAAPLKVGAAA